MVALVVKIDIINRLQWAMELATLQKRLHIIPDHYKKSPI